MTRPVMIDGVDVSRCLHFNECDCSCLLRANSSKIKIFCKLYSDCYHKRYHKRYRHKIAECEKLKAKLQIATEVLEKITKNYSCPYTECDKCSKTCSMHEINQALERIKE